MTTPISPSEALSRVGEEIPDEVIEIFNALILENFNGKTSTFTGIEAWKRIMQWCSINNKTYKSSWLSIEPAFQKAGWKVEGDWPGYNESYAGSWTFTAK